MNVDLFLSKVNEVKNFLINKATQNGTLVLNDRMLDSIFKDACNITARHCKNAAGSYIFTGNNFFGAVETNVKALKKNPDTNMRARKAAITALVANVVSIDADITTNVMSNDNPYIIHVYPGMDLKTVIDGITDASETNIYTVICYPGCTVGVGLVWKPYIRLETVGHPFLNIGGALIGNDMAEGNPAILMGDFSAIDGDTGLPAFIAIGLDLSNSIIIPPILRKSDIREVDLEDFNALTNLTMGETLVYRTDENKIYLSHATEGGDGRNFELLTPTNFSNAYMPATNLYQSLIRCTVFDNCTLKYANIAECEASYCNFTSCQLSNADLRYGVFRWASMVGAGLDYCNCKQTNFQYANLTNANFAFANLYQANLWGANIANALMISTNLTGATMPDNANTKAAFKSVVGNGKWDAATTIWIDGLPIGA